MAWRPGGKLVVTALYAAVLLGSQATRGCRAPHDAASPEVDVVQVGAVGAARSGRADVRVAYLDLQPPGDPAGEPILLLHGSPGTKRDLEGLGRLLSRHRRVLLPDLPGFGKSERELPDYSAAAGAVYAAQLLDRLGVERVHVVGFSMGGVVAVELADRMPARVASLTLLSATGVQELELLGQYHLNHLVHGAQLALLWALQNGVPHFGAWDDAYIDVGYARNFFDTDPRPVRGMLSRWQGPALILHGRSDVLVPVEAALEHSRLVPQSEILLFDANHFLPFTRPARMADAVSAFVDRAERGDAPRRADADPDRLSAAARPYDPGASPPAAGLALVVVGLLILAATLVSEDLACIGAGLMVAHGRIDFLPAVVACLTGIVLGDMGLFLAGRFLGRAALHRAPLRWLLRAEQVERSRVWCERRGFVVILLSRFTPGARLPTYFVSGLLGMRLRTFAAYFLAAAAAWTPLLVGLAALVGHRTLHWVEGYRRLTLPVLILVGVGVLVFVRLVLPLATFRGRRRLVGWWRRWSRWEFWPPWAFYPPVAAYVAILALRAKHRTAFTAANPAMDAGGFVGESKSAILQGLQSSPERVAAWARVPGQGSPAVRMGIVRDLASRYGWPVVLKPDTGQRGDGVRVIRSEPAAESHLSRNREDLIVQQYVPGVEFGLFYARPPGRDRGTVFSVTEKVLPEVVGDGRSSLERLILSHPRHVAMSRVYLERNAAGVDRIPEAGERVRLVDLGTHCRGAVFLDGARVKTPALEEEVDRISRAYDGFSFGRFDVRAPTEEDLREGRFQVLELNGVTSEATHIYDPGIGLFQAYRTLFRQWRLAFEIGEAHAESGHPTVSVAGLLARLRDYRARSRERESAGPV